MDGMTALAAPPAPNNNMEEFEKSLENINNIDQIK